MKYMGSKARIAKYILPIIQERLSNYNIHTYIELFSGVYLGISDVYLGIVHTKTGTERNHYDEAKKNLLEQIPKLKNIQFQF